MVEYCGVLLNQKDGDVKHKFYTEQNKNKGTNYGSYMFNFNIPNGKKYW